MCPLAVLVKEDKDAVPALVERSDFSSKFFYEFRYVSVI